MGEVFATFSRGKDNVRTPFSRVEVRVTSPPRAFTIESRMDIADLGLQRNSPSNTPVGQMAETSLVAPYYDIACSVAKPHQIVCTDSTGFQQR